MLSNLLLLLDGHHHYFSLIALRPCWLDPPCLQGCEASGTIAAMKPMPTVGLPTCTCHDACPDLDVFRINCLKFLNGPTRVPPTQQHAPRTAVHHRNPSIRPTVRWLGHVGCAARSSKICDHKMKQRAPQDPSLITMWFGPSQRKTQRRVSDIIWPNPTCPSLIQHVVLGSGRGC